MSVFWLIKPATSHKTVYFGQAKQAGPALFVICDIAFIPVVVYNIVMNDTLLPYLGTKT